MVYSSVVIMKQKAILANEVLLNQATGKLGANLIRDKDITYRNIMGDEELKAQMVIKPLKRSRPQQVMHMG